MSVLLYYSIDCAVKLKLILKYNLIAFSIKIKRPTLSDEN